MGTSLTMQIMGRFRTDHSTDDEIDVIVIETDEHETLVFEGVDRDEVEAKVEDFLTWAS